jgi:hypothetical protein
MLVSPVTRLASNQFDGRTLNGCVIYRTASDSERDQERLNLETSFNS